jgi:hypothetical protein
VRVPCFVLATALDPLFFSGDLMSRKQIKHRGEAPVSKHLRVPVSPGQEAAIKARAAEMNLTAADYIRSLAQADIETHGSTTPWPEARRFYQTTEPEVSEVLDGAE